MTKHDKIVKDLQAFADDPNSVEVVQNLASFKRFGQDITFELQVDRDTDSLWVVYNGQKLPYKKFFAKEIARLDIFANKIIEYRKVNQEIVDEISNYDEPFVEGEATLFSFENSSNGEKGRTIDLLNKECENTLPTSTKVTFITADAGHGKTYLLKQYQYIQAEKFIKGETNFLFWHVDMQGRQLVRLDEAIMRDLGELRVPGIYMSSIYYLLKNNLLVLSIDGFDELAAETGNTEALGALANLVSKLEGQGIIIAASRRTFFDYNDYVKKTKMLPRAIGESNDCVFNELKLNNWEKGDNLKYLEEAFILNERSDNPEDIYNEIFEIVGENENHAFLSIPFLFSRIIKALVRYNDTPKRFLGQINSIEGVKSIIEKFIKREVSDKWITKEGIPYLTEEQHIELLTSIAEDMWKQQKDALPIEDIIFNTKILCEQWRIDDAKQQDSIIRMIKMHALLVPAGSGQQLRKFDHPEYKNYFVANALIKLIETQLKTPEKSLNILKSFLDHSQLPDHVGLYTCNILKHDKHDLGEVIEIFKRTISEEWTPSMLHVNIGTIFPFIANEYKPDTVIKFGDTFENRISFSSIVFENKTLTNIEFYKANFTNISFKNTVLENVKFINCNFSEIKIFNNSNLFSSVIIERSEIYSVTKLIEEEEIEKGFAPIRVYQILESIGIHWADNESKQEIRSNNIDKVAIKEATNIKKLTYRLLNSFRRTSLMYNYNINIKFSTQDARIIEDKVIPLMIEFGLLREEETKNVKTYDRKGWRLLYRIDDLLKADNYKQETELERFWIEINNK